MHMVPLATTRSGFEAQVLAARLGSEGILWQLRGGSADSVYPVGAVDVLVAADDLDRARELLAATSDDPARSSASARGKAERDHTEWWLAAVVVGLLVLFVVLRVFSL
jgi:hypothetical protein